MEFSFNYTFEDYKEANRAVRKSAGKPLSTGASQIIIVLTGVLGAALLITSTLLQQDSVTNELHPTKLSTFLFAMIPWILVLGAGWAVAVGRAGPVSRASIRRILLTFLLTGVCFSILISLTPAPAAAPVTVREVLLQIAPWLVFLVGVCIGFLQLLKMMYRRMWDGMQHLRLPHTARFLDERAEFENPNALCSYRWPAFVTFRETANLFVLQTSKFTFHMFPKRACRDGQEIEALRRLIEKNVANAQPVSFGFAVVASAPPPPLPPRMVESLPPRTMN